MDEKIDVEAQQQRRHRLSWPKRNWFSVFSLAVASYVLWKFFLWEALASKLPFYGNHDAPVKTSGWASSVLISSLDKTNLAGQWLKDYTEDNQLAGTNLRMVNYTLEKFKELGLEDAYVDQYTTYISYPLENSLSLLQNKSVVYKPSLIEDKLDEDPNSSYYVPAFLGYAASGNVTAEYVYCNYGRYEDFQKLVELGVDLRGKIAIARYGAIYRGLKIKFAQDLGMSAVLLYSDTADDGEVIEENGFKPYPHGFARNPSAIQRGSALFLSMTPGDPTTPGYAIKPGEKKPRVEPYDTIPRIPALPISYKEVAPILKKLSGHGPKIEGWEGLVKDYDYSVGPNADYSLNLYNKQDFNISVMNNIMGKIKGTDDSKFILVGNHHDSWTPAAADPHSGSATLLEIIRAFGELVKTGWQPKISIVFASWDGEEYGLIGSTEYAEYYQQELKRKCVAYVNSDVSTIGSILSLQASPLLNEVLLETTKELQYPNSTISLYEHFLEKSGGKIGTLGSGSDYTVFLEHLGIPSVDLGFKNDQKNSSVYQYHSLYDSYYWMSKFGDPGFVYHNLMAKYMSLLILHLSDEPVLRLRTHDYAVELEKYFDDLHIPRHWLRPAKKCGHGKSSQKTPDDHGHHPHHPEPPHVRKLVKKVSKKLKILKSKTAEFDDYLRELVNQFKNWDSLTYWQRIKLIFKTRAANSILQFYERHLLDDKGLNNRPWFKHVVFASGRYTGYKGQELPGLAEAIEDNNLNDFTDKLRRLDQILDTLLKMSSL